VLLDAASDRSIGL